MFKLTQKLIRKMSKPNLNPWSSSSLMFASIIVTGPYAPPKIAPLLHNIYRSSEPCFSNVKFFAGQPLIYPRNDLSYTENFLHMMFAVKPPHYVLVIGERLHWYNILTNSWTRILDLKLSFYDWQSAWKTTACPNLFMRVPLPDILGVLSNILKNTPS